MEGRLVPVPDQSRPPKEHECGVTGLPSGESPSAYKGHTVVTTYNVSHDSRRLYSTLVDRGANGTVAGSDLRVVYPHNKHTHLTGVGDNTIRDLPLVACGGTTRTNKGDVILIFCWGAHLPDGKTIASAGQMEHYGWTVNDKSSIVTGETPSMTSPEGYTLPMEYRDGLPYIHLRPYTDHEWTTLPHLYATSPHSWDPRCLDAKVPDDWYVRAPVDNSFQESSDFDDRGQAKPGRFVPLDDDDEPGVSRATVRAYATHCIRDEIRSARRAHNAFQRRRNRRNTAPDDLVQLDDTGKRATAQPVAPPSHPTLVSPKGEKSQDLGSQSATEDSDTAMPRLLGRDRRRDVDSADSDSEEDSTQLPKLGLPPRQPKPRKPAPVASSNGEQTETTAVETDVPGYASDSTEPPELLELPLYWEPPSDSSDSEDDSPPGLPTFNSKAKTATGIELPPKKWKLRNIRKKDTKKLKQIFVGANQETIKRTLEATTQYASRGAVEGTNLRQQIKSPNPVLNIPRRCESVATDQIYSSTPAIKDGTRIAQFFIGTISMFRAVYSLGKSNKNYPQALMDEVRKRGAMNKIISDSAKNETSKRVMDFCRAMCIDDWQSEKGQQRQNDSERGIRTTMHWAKVLFNLSNAPPECWLLLLKYVCFLQNHLAYKSLGWRTAWEWIFGYTPDISVLLQFRYYQPVYFARDDASFPEDPTERIGRFVGVAEHVGHGMTFWILTERGDLIARAVVRSAIGPERNLRLDGNEADDEDSDDEDDPEVTEFKERFRKALVMEDENPHAQERDSIWLRSDDKDKPAPKLDVEDIIGRTYITDPDENGEQGRAKIVEMHPTGDVTPDGKQAIHRFKCKYKDKFFEEVMSYNKMLEWCDRDLDKDDMYRMDGIVDHRKKQMPNTKGDWEVLVKWADGTQSWNCLNMTYTDDPVTVSVYAKKRGLLDVPGWKRCKRDLKNMKQFGRMINQTRLKNYRRRPVYKYGYQVPRDHEEAVFIDEKNGNTKWQDSEKLELKQLMDYETFRDIGYKTPVPEGYTKIPCRLIYDVKHCGRHKSRFIAGGHKTPTPEESVYSGVVSLQGIRMVTFLAELNDLELWATDIGNAYLESYTSEKVCFTAGGEFGELAGHTFVIVKAQYGLKSSGRCWHDRLFEVLWNMGFRPSKAESDIWMRDAGDHWEYVACYVDDLLIASREPQKIIDDLEGKPHKFKLKGTGPVEFHLGCDFWRDSHGTLCVGPKKYIERLAMQYEDLFGESPKTKYRSPVDKDDHPELDTSPLLDEDGVSKYQSLIGALQWTVTLGRFDIAVAVMTMSSYRVAPRRGHLERVKRIVGYLLRMKNGYIRVRTDMPDYEGMPPAKHDWSHTVYGDVKEVIPKDLPKAMGKPVKTTSYVDANLYHDWVTGRSVTGVMHLLNKTPVEWFAKKQATVETATYGSEFVAGRHATEQILGIRTTLRYLGVPIEGESKLFGDNGSVVTNASVPHSQLKKRHHALSYHFTREAIASNAIDFQYIWSEINAADILSKHWGYSQVWKTLQPLLFWEGDTADLLEDK